MRQLEMCFNVQGVIKSYQMLYPICQFRKKKYFPYLLFRRGWGCYRDELRSWAWRSTLGLLLRMIPGGGDCKVRIPQV